MRLWTGLKGETKKGKSGSGRGEKIERNAEGWYRGNG